MHDAHQSFARTLPLGQPGKINAGDASIHSPSVLEGLVPSKYRGFELV
jgi:hypothetical protein